MSSVTNGEEAMDRIREIKPELVFLDVMMPKKDGYEVCREVKEDPVLKETFVIMLTARGQETDREKGLSLGVDDFITKPFSSRQLIAQVKELLG